MYSFQPIKQTKATDEVLEQLKESIIKGMIKEGEKLPSERALSNVFNVSRGVVREAIHGLKATGFVEIKQGPLGGTFVKEISLELLETGFTDLFFANKLTIAEILDVRQYIEPEIARLAALNVNDDYRKALNIALAEENQPFVSPDDLLNKLTAVHFILAEMCGNRLFEGMISAIILNRRIIKTLLKKLLKLHGTGGHDEIVQAVIAGDPEAALKAMARHVSDFRSVFLKLEQDEG
ncbi:transcriptional regulator, GntR family [Desulfosarcina variabilis str. Montpellier]|uniref:FadR/GntR family transcriptional regulator n=1 Tax=Desulfosarcina variabilis TaxID=2300 RepID=UPI003AFB1644